MQKKNEVTYYLIKFSGTIFTYGENHKVEFEQKIEYNKSKFIESFENAIKYMGKNFGYILPVKNSLGHNLFFKRNYQYFLDNCFDSKLEIHKLKTKK